MIALITDSNAQLSPELAAHLGVWIVPLVISIDGKDYAEGVDLGVDEFYDILAGSHEISTSQPSPGRFLETYLAAAEGGATEILSVHIGAQHSGTVNSAMVASRRTPIPVRVVDTTTASFGIAFCVRRASEVLTSGGSTQDAVLAIEALVPSIESVFIIQALNLVHASGRIDLGPNRVPDESGETTEVPVLATRGADLTVVGSATTLDAAVEVMAEHVVAGGDRLRVALSVADAASDPLWQRLESRLAAAPEVVELTHYRVGPSLAAHLGAGTAGAFFHQI